MIYIDSSGSESDEWDMGPLVNIPNNNVKTVNNVYKKSDKDLLLDSIASSDLLGVEDILENSDEVDVETILDNFGTALMHACLTSQSHIVEYLIKKGANVNRNNLRQTPLLCACSSYTGQKIVTVECVKLLLTHNARVNVSDVNGRTPLMIAIQLDHDDVALMLLPISNIEMEDSKGWKASFYAVNKQKPYILRKLISKGASLSDMDNNEVSLETMGRLSENEEIRAIVKEFATEIEDDDEEYLMYLSKKSGWEDQYPDIFDGCEKPEYSYDVFQMLCGMNCEALIPKFENANLSLQEFLLLDETDLINIGIEYPFQRYKVLQGIDKFFSREWNSKSVAGTTELGSSFDIVQCLTNVSFHRKQLAVINCNLIYLKKKATDLNTDKEYEDCMIAQSKVTCRLRNNIQKLKAIINNLDTSTKECPPDYISKKVKYRENYFRNIFINYSLKLLGTISVINIVNQIFLK